jgi:predicted RNA-binding protein YlxR (DUF448 family)
VACRTTREKRDLVRVVRTPTGDVIIDPSGRAAGRGAYVCRDVACVDRAITKGALSRALHNQLPPDLMEVLAGSVTTHDTIEGGTRGQE